MRHCDMGPQKFTYCPLRLISDFTFFRYISNLQRRILQKTFIRTFPQANRPTMALFHRVNALPLHRFFPPSLPQKNFFASQQNFFCAPACYPRCNPTTASRHDDLPSPGIRRQVIHAHGWIFLCWRKCWDNHNPPAFFLGVNSVDLPLTRHRPRPQDRKKDRLAGVSRVDTFGS